MLRVWQKKLLNNKTDQQFDFGTPGSYSHVFEAGIWEIWLVGGGGGGASASVGEYYGRVDEWAKGGVGGVIGVKIKVLEKTTATINIANVTNSVYINTTDGEITAQNGQNTSITGLDGVDLVAGGGGGAYVYLRRYSSSSRVATRTPGVQGTNTATGENLIEIIENNKNIIISENGELGVVQRYAQPNTNWAEDTSRGCGGSVYFTGSDISSAVAISGGIGFVRIKTSN